MTSNPRTVASTTADTTTPFGRSSFFSASSEISPALLLVIDSVDDLVAHGNKDDAVDDDAVGDDAPEQMSISTMFLSQSDAMITPSNKDSSSGSLLAQADSNCSSDETLINRLSSDPECNVESQPPALQEVQIQKHDDRAPKCRHGEKLDRVHHDARAPSLQTHIAIEILLPSNIDFISMGDHLIIPNSIEDLDIEDLEQEDGALLPALH
ncbi:unnamed protein product [Discula destructiva]